MLELSKKNTQKHPSHFIEGFLAAGPMVLGLKTRKRLVTLLFSNVSPNQFSLSNFSK